MARPAVVSILASAVVAALACFLLPATALACTPKSCGGGGGGSDPGIGLSVGAVQGVEGAPLSEGFATMVDRDPLGTASDYAVSVNWGDGSSGPVALSETGSDPQTGARFALVSNHAYHFSGAFQFCISVFDIGTQAGVGGCGTAVIEEAALAVHGLTEARANPYCAAMATFSDGNPYPFVGDFEAAIDWGDGASSPGLVVDSQPNGPGPHVFTVQGCHTYADLGPHTVTTTVSDEPIQATASGTAWVYAPTDGGTFAVGDGNAVPGATVTYTGPQWATDNTLSGGSAPDSFKGFAPGASPICGGTWSARPGDSAAPPAAVPSYTAVLVTSSVSKHGAQIDGDSVHVALVRTHPGAPGTGTVVFTIC